MYDSVFFTPKEPVRLSALADHDREGLLPECISVKTFPVLEGYVWPKYEPIALRDLFLLFHSTSPPFPRVVPASPLIHGYTYGLRMSQKEDSLGVKKTLPGLIKH